MSWSSTARIYSVTDEIKVPTPPTIILPPLLADGQAYTDMQRGMFVHYSLATFVGTEFVDPTTPIDVFNPTALDVAQWAEVASDFGSVYATLTIKHFDGFCLWPTTSTVHGIAGTTWYASHGEPDITRMFCDECRARGVLPSFYYNLADTWWHHINPSGTDAEYKAYVEGQIIEVLNRYGPIAAIWLDSTEVFWGNSRPWSSAAERAAFFHNVSNNTQIGLVMVNNAHTGTLADTDVVEYESAIPPGGNTNPAESCFSLADGWFWTSDTGLGVDAGTMGDRIIYCNANNAGILINVPPNTTGIMPAPYIERLDQIRMYLGEIPRQSPNTMTSNTTPSPYVASASSEYVVGASHFEAYHAFNSSLDSFWSSNGGLPAFIKIDLGSSQTSSKYMVQTRKGGVYHQWLAWTLAGSNDDSSWTNVHSVTQSSVLPGEVRFYTMTSPGSYRYWRWTITSSNTGTDADVASLALFA